MSTAFGRYHIKLITYNNNNEYAVAYMYVMIPNRMGDFALA